MDKLILVSNRLPVTAARRGKRLSVQPSVGGLARSLDNVRRLFKVVWVGWPGLPEDDIEDRDALESSLSQMGLKPVFLSRSDVQGYYHGYSNRTIWPLFHYFPEYAVSEERFWRSYVEVNKKFRDAVMEVYERGDIIWVHDYHLFLLPRMLREEEEEAAIGFFLHIPFPSPEVFRILPQRREVLEGLLGSDLIGFHTFKYMRNFLESVRAILGFETSAGRVYTGDRVVLVDAFPLGIDYDWFSEVAGSPQVQKEAKRIRRRVRGRKVILSADRLDYTKGIPARLEAYEQLLEEHEEYRGKVTLILVVSPSRTGVAEYRRLKEEIDKLVGRINGRFGGLDWMPVWYVYRYLPGQTLLAMYQAADVMLVTPYRDGMNLMAKEYLASRRDGLGVLVLSEMAGAADELWEALIVNPYDKKSIVKALREALSMSEEEQRKRNRRMRERLKRYNVIRWSNEFIGRLLDARSMQREYEVRSLEREWRRVIEDYEKAESRLIILDYDGTLVRFTSSPEQSRPDPELKNLLASLSSVCCNEVVIVSGRDRYTLESWLGDTGVGLVAEHGAWIKERGKEWTVAVSVRTDWKREVRPVMELFADRTPGSLVEEKDFSLVWHYRMVEPELGVERAAELKQVLLGLAASYGLQVVDGNKALEVRVAGVNKGEAVKKWLGKNEWGFILAAGDDVTDEDMFAVLPESAYTVKIRIGPSKAKYYLDSPDDLRRLLQEMIEAGKAAQLRGASKPE